MAKILTTDEARLDLMKGITSIAVIGAKGPGKGPAHKVPAYLLDHGYTIHPVHPREETILDQPVVRSVREVHGAIDLVLIFRRSEALPGHLDEILALNPRPRAVWMQLGIEHDEVAKSLVDAGIDVVQDRCMMVEHRNLLA